MSGMPSRLETIALIQRDFVVGAVEENADTLLALARAHRGKADLLLASELCLTGYPPEDLLLRRSFVERAEEAAHKLARRAAGLPLMVIGAPWREEGALYNAALLLGGGRIMARRYKSALPNYGVFDERRLFTQAAPQEPCVIGGCRIGLLLCEDLWRDESMSRLDAAELLFVLNGSPYERGKNATRQIGRAHV